MLTFVGYPETQLELFPALGVARPQAASDLDAQLRLSTPIDLKGLAAVSLQNRVDTKYVCTQDVLLEVLDSVRDSYCVLHLDDVVLARYDSQYFDTADWRLFADHHVGKADRYKVRTRRYLDTQFEVFEVKHRLNSGRCDKKRIDISTHRDLAIDETQEFQKFGLPYEAAELFPTVRTIYRRATLVDMDLTERITIDVDLAFELDGERAEANNLAIIEVKQSRRMSASPMARALLDRRVHQGSMSKYAYGAALLAPAEVRRNRFKPLIRNVERVLAKAAVNGDDA